MKVRHKAETEVGGWEQGLCLSPLPFLLASERREGAEVWTVGMWGMGQLSLEFCHKEVC